ncbi:MAG: putative membrane protein [uncultured archaeon A07HN63]|nr:MAG: putative membrane protein [uncultured archaeon A07HN63]
MLSVLWLRYFRFGPLEWLWRTVTYGERQPLRN